MTAERPRPTSESMHWSVEKQFDGDSLSVRIVPIEGTNTGELSLVPEVRKLAMNVLSSLGITARHDEVELVLAEFVTNCVEHGTGIKEVGFDYTPETLTVRTVNGVSKGEPLRLPDESQRGEVVNELPFDEAEDGRGLMLTEALADSWQQRVSRNGRRVITVARFDHINRGDQRDAPPPQAA